MFHSLTYITCYLFEYIIACSPPADTYEPHARDIDFFATTLRAGLLTGADLGF
jgi:hypothetical protein